MEHEQNKRQIQFKEKPMIEPKKEQPKSKLWNGFINLLEKT